MSDSSFRMGLRTKPYVFTEHGVTMLAAVLKSQTAINISLSIIDAFIAMRRFISQEDALKFNAQYPKLEIIFNNTFHDRFLIIDDRDLYLIGASLKDLGKKCFGFTQLDSCFISDIKKRIY